MSAKILVGDCRARLKELPDASVDSVVCDPPYHLTSIVKRFGKPGSAPINNRDEREGRNGPYQRTSKGFMGQTWDGGDVAFQPETWAEVLRVLKPGGHLVAFSGTRTYHRMVCAIEDAGFEIRDQIMWVYGSGFPKSYNTAQCIEKKLTTGKARRPDRELGLTRNRYSGSTEGTLIANTGGHVPLTTPEAKQWEGWGTALKPAHEPICLARKPLIGTVVDNVLAHGTGALNIDGCRIESEVLESERRTSTRGASDYFGLDAKQDGERHNALGRWPANLCHDGSDEVLAGFPETTSGGGWCGDHKASPNRAMSGGNTARTVENGYGGDSGSAARFFYCAKASARERGEGNNHPTVKPIALMRWLARLVTPPGGTVLDPFMGSGSGALACDLEHFNFIGCELSREYAEIARGRMERQFALAGLFVGNIEISEAAA